MVSKVHANKLLEVTMGTNSITFPARVYLGLCASEPNHDTGAVTGEPTIGDNYKRKLVGGSQANPKYFSASGGIIKNSEEIQMQTAKTGYGLQNYWFLSEDETAKTAIIWGEIKNKDGGTGITVGDETVPVFYKNELKASIDVPFE